MDLQELKLFAGGDALTSHLQIEAILLSGSKRFALGGGLHPCRWRPLAALLELVHLSVEARLVVVYCFVVEGIRTLDLAVLAPSPLP